MTQRPRYAVRLNQDRREYQVYDVSTQRTVASFGYIRTELSRGAAHGRANSKREELNRSAAALTDDEWLRTCED